VGTPSWLYYLFALAMLAVAAHALVLFRASIQSADPAGRDVDIAHFAMGITMAGMFVPHWAFWPTWLWEVVFFGLLVWFLVKSAQSLLRFGPHVPHEGVHAAMSLAMLLMYLFPMAASAGAVSMSMTSSSHAMLDPGVSFTLAVIFFGSAVFTLASPYPGASHHGTHRSHSRAYTTVGGPTPSAIEQSNGAGGERSSTNFLTSPKMEDLNHVVMCVGMGFMLILMI
jgi:Domain of unknown function (DUF5134)